MNKSFRKSSRWSKCIHFNQIIQSHSTRRLTHFTFTPSDHEHPCFTISFRLLAFSDFKLLPEGWLWFLFVFSHLLVKFNIFSWVYGHWGFLFFFHVNCLILAFAHFSLFSVFPFLLSILEFYLYFIYLLFYLFICILFIYLDYYMIVIHFLICGVIMWASQVLLVVKNLPANAGDRNDVSLIPGSGRLWYGNPLQYSCLENPMGWGAWLAIVPRVAKSQTQLKRLSMHAQNDHISYQLRSTSRLYIVTLLI